MGAFRFKGGAEWATPSGYTESVRSRFGWVYRWRDCASWSRNEGDIAVLRARLDMRKSMRGPVLVA
jgi:hypothetical protein